MRSLAHALAGLQPKVEVPLTAKGGSCDRRQWPTGKQIGADVATRAVLHFSIQQ
jgi:hypothetical protein